MRLRAAIRQYLHFVLAILAFVAIASVVAVYIVQHQRLRFPWEYAKRIEAEFASAQAVTPGQGQTVVVSGVKVGEIVGVRVEGDRAVVEIDITDEQLGPIYEDARMLLRPRTGLNDMMIQLDPGTPRADELEEGERLPIAQTTSNVNLDEILAKLDADTRRYLAILSNAGGQAIRDRGRALRRILRASEPTLARSARVTQAVASRRRELGRLIHNLRQLSETTAARDGDLARLVRDGATVVTTLARRDQELTGAVERLPAALDATAAAFEASGALAGELKPAMRALGPGVRELPEALRALRPLTEDAHPLVRDGLRPLARESVPVLRDLRPSLSRLYEAQPQVRRLTQVLNYVANELAHNPRGPEEGYLFWAAWFFHNANSIVSIEDAHGAAWRGLLMVGCSSLSDAVPLPTAEALGLVAACQTANRERR